MYLSFVEDVDTSLAPNTLLINMFSCYASRCYNNNAPPQQREERLVCRVIFYGPRGREKTVCFDRHFVTSHVTDAAVSSSWIFVSAFGVSVHSVEDVFGLDQVNWIGMSG